MRLPVTHSFHLFHSAVLLLHGSFANLQTLNIAPADAAYVALQVKSDNETEFHHIFLKRSEMWEEVQWFRARLCRLDFGKSSQYLDLKPWSPKLTGANNRLLFYMHAKRQIKHLHPTTSWLFLGAVFPTQEPGTKVCNAP